MTKDAIVLGAAATARIRRLERLENSMEVGSSVFLEFERTDEEPLRDRSMLRGWKQGNYIIVDRPVRKDKHLFRAHDMCAMRFVRDGTAWGFQTFVLALSPGRREDLLWLSWPEDASFIALRRHERIKLQVPCLLHTEDDAVFRATVRDISVSGCCISGSGLPLVTEARLNATFTLPDGAAIEETSIIVRNQKKGPGNEHNYGCEFLDPGKADQESIHFFLLKSLSSQRSEALAGDYYLLLTDNEETLGRLQTLARQENVNLLTASCVVDMCCILRSSTPSVLLLDVSRAEIAIPDLCHMVHETIGLSEMPIVLLGATAWREGQEPSADGVQLCVRDLDAITSFQLLSTCGPRPQPGATSTNAI